VDGDDLLMGCGPLLATLIRAPWQLYLTLGRGLASGYCLRPHHARRAALTQAR